MRRAPGSKTTVPFAVTRPDRIDARRYYDPEFYRARAGKALAARLADGVPAAGNREARRLRRLRDLRPVGDRRARRREDRQGVPQPLPASRREAGAGPRERARTASPVRSTAGNGVPTVQCKFIYHAGHLREGPAARAPTSRCASAGSRPGAGARSSTSTTTHRRCASRSSRSPTSTTPGTSRACKVEWWYRGAAARELEARHGGLHGGLPRAGDASAAGAGRPDQAGDDRVRAAAADLSPMSPYQTSADARRCRRRSPSKDFIEHEHLLHALLNEGMAGMTHAKDVAAAEALLETPLPEDLRWRDDGVAQEAQRQRWSRTTASRAWTSATSTTSTPGITRRPSTTASRTTSCCRLTAARRRTASVRSARRSACSSSGR